MTNLFKSKAQIIETVARISKTSTFRNDMLYLYKELQIDFYKNLKTKLYA